MVLVKLFELLSFILKRHIAEINRDVLGRSYGYNTFQQLHDNKS